jgi:hypothetical protein
MVTFENLDDLLGALDDSIEVHKRAIDRYSNFLGGLLRSTLGGGAVPQASIEMRPPQNAPDQKDRARFGLFKSQPSGQPAKKTKLDENSQGWTVIESGDFSVKVATGQTSLVNQKKTESLFKIVEALKAKVTMLEIARKSLAELPSRGLRANQIISVVFKDGIPRQVIPSNETKDSRPKFGFTAEFEVEPMRSR